MKKAAILLIISAVLISYQAAAVASSGQSDAKGKCKTNFTPANKHKAA